MRTKLLASMIFVVLSGNIVLPWSAHAEAPSPPAPAPKPEIASIRVEKALAPRLKKVVIMLTGADSVQTRLLEETLGLQLLKQEIGVVSRLRVERLLAEEMVKNRSASEKDQPKAIHSTTIAKNAGATAILSGTLHNEARVKLGEKEVSPRLVRCVSLQLLSVETEEVLWSAYGEFDDSVSYIEMARQLLGSIAAQQ